jgi:hypothetical protein
MSKKTKNDGVKRVPTKASPEKRKLYNDTYRSKHKEKIKARIIEIRTEKKARKDYKAEWARNKKDKKDKDKIDQYNKDFYGTDLSNG